MKISKINAEHYIWGENCDGWQLVKNNDISVIHERMPPNTQEVRHYHHKSRQFFFVLKGLATIEVNGEIFDLSQNEGIEVAPQIPHQMFNHSDEEIEFLVISQPNSKDDRETIS
ncbi:cupin domain-containing protein [Gottfriedia solisilvae]|uniref:cupin domain-containing protein n=1 Tax=Gottfriedia solisilvae TaxID=1516104 RepID=UPI003D2ED139